jgi:hypothetical protein
MVAGGCSAGLSTGGSCSSPLASSEVYGFAWVKTDAADYPPGTTVNITRGGWQPGQTATLTAVESPLIDTCGPYTVTADADGNISDSSFVTDSHDINILFYLTATGSASQAQTTFTDAAGKTTALVGAVTWSLTPWADRRIPRAWSWLRAALPYPSPRRANT